ncbi:hypothetical protein NA57DRAFT_81075 [Rhizodiscina lignyota]|uniref:Uncharacterized protein n=1 Tax=Rhizodiscina lignyota TaxID=1504668 RepID=A0A9P4I7Q2_9PEZI|nr:hypothetical protein NA57DRAFT_81075 [Rhizodiscina lignyota]
MAQSSALGLLPLELRRMIYAASEDLIQRNVQLQLSLRHVAPPFDSVEVIFPRLPNRKLLDISPALFLEAVEYFLGMDEVYICVWALAGQPFNGDGLYIVAGRLKSVKNCKISFAEDVERISAGYNASHDRLVKSLIKSLPVLQRCWVGIAVPWWNLYRKAQYTGLTALSHPKINFLKRVCQRQFRPFNFTATELHRGRIISRDFLYSAHHIVRIRTAHGASPIHQPIYSCEGPHQALTTAQFNELWLLVAQGLARLRYGYGVSVLLKLTEWNHRWDHATFRGAPSLLFLRSGLAPILVNGHLGKPMVLMEYSAERMKLSTGTSTLALYETSLAPINPHREVELTFNGGVDGLLAVQRFRQAPYVQGG